MARSYRGAAIFILFIILAIWFLQERLSDADPNTSSSWKSAIAEKMRLKKLFSQLITDNNGGDNLLDTQNATLGFQKIYVLSLPSRSDKRDALAISAKVSGLKIKFLDGVKGDKVLDKAYPQKWDKEEPLNTIGAWRGHMEIYQKMVREGIQTALIFEDDADWDVMIKQQMTEFARGTRHLQNSTVPMLSPYGDNWSLLFTGHCGVWNKPQYDQDYWVIENDPTVIDPSRRDWHRQPNLSPEPIAGNNSRTIFSAYKLTCSTSYGISLKGATQLIYDQAVLPNGRSIDTAMAAFCKRAQYGFNSCIAPYPMITGTHRPAGDTRLDSDRTDKKHGKIRAKAFSSGLVYSVRLNLGRLLKGNTTVKAQFPGSSLMRQIDIQTLQLPTGHAVSITKDQYTDGGVDAMSGMMEKAKAANAGNATTKSEGPHASEASDLPTAVELQATPGNYSRRGHN